MKMCSYHESWGDEFKPKLQCDTTSHHYNKKDSDECWHDVEKLEPPLIAGDTGKYNSYFGKKLAVS